MLGDLKLSVHTGCLKKVALNWQFHKTAIPKKALGSKKNFMFFVWCS